MRKPVFAICEQQRRRSACSLISTFIVRSLDSSCYVQNFKTLSGLCGCADRFESYLVANPEDRFSRDEAQMFVILVNFSSDSILGGTEEETMLPLCRKRK